MISYISRYIEHYRFPLLFALRFLFLIWAGGLLTGEGHSQEGLQRPAVAILSSQSRSELGGLLTAALSQGDKFVVLERQALEEIVEEGKLSGESLAGKLAAADILLVVENVDSGKLNLTVVRAVSRNTGEIFWSIIRPADQNPDELLKEIKTGLSKFRSATNGKDENATPSITVRMFRREFEIGKVEPEEESVAFSKLIASRLSAAAAIRVKERFDLASIQFERQLAKIVEEGFQESDYSIYGTYRAAEKGKTSYAVWIRQKGHILTSTVKGAVDSADPGQLADSIVKSVIAELNDGLPRTPVKKNVLERFRASEGEHYLDEANRAIKLGLHKTAARYAETALLLGVERNLDDRTKRLIERLKSMGRQKEADQYAKMALLQGVNRRIDCEILCIDGRILSMFPELEGVGFDPKTGRLANGGFLEMFLRQWPERLPERSNELSADQLSQFCDIYDSLADIVVRELGGGKRKQLGDRKFLQYERSFRQKFRALEVFPGALVWGLFAKYRGKLPEPERQQLDRLIAMEKRVSVETDIKFGSLNEINTRLLLAGDAGKALEILKKEYGKTTQSAELKSDVAKLKKIRSERAKLARTRLTMISHFDWIAWKAGLNSAGSMPFREDLIGTAFVAGFTDHPKTIDPVFEKLIESRLEEGKNLGKLDRLIRDYAKEGGKDKLNDIFAAFRENEEELIENGESIIYGIMVMTLRRSKRAEDLDKDQIQKSMEFWKWLHRKVYEKIPEGAPRLTDDIADFLKYSNWKELSKDTGKELLESMRKDLITYNGKNQADFAISTKNLEKVLIIYGGGKAKTEDKQLSMVETQLDFEIQEFWYYFLWGYKIESYFDEGGVFSLNRFQRNGEKFISVEIYDHKNKRFYKRIDLPDELKYKINGDAMGGWKGDLRRDGGILRVAGPGFVAGCKLGDHPRWEYDSVEALENMDGYRFVNNSMYAYRGRGFDERGFVYGLYRYNLRNGKVSALIDTSRRPLMSHLDSNSELKFLTSPVHRGKDGAFVVIEESREKPSILFIQDDKIDSEPIWKWHGAQYKSWANGFSADFGKEFSWCIQIGRRGYQTSAKNETREFQVSMFAVNRDSGDVEYLLDTGKRGNREFSVFSDPKDPVFTFPAKYRKYKLNKPGQVGKWVGSFDGERLLLMALNSNVLYVWRNREQKEPTVVFLSYKDFFKNEDLTEKELKDHQESAHYITRIQILGDTVFFEHAIGGWRFSWKKLEEAIEKKAKAD